MNMMLLDETELRDGLPVGDRRAQHTLRVLKKQPGESLLAGLVNKISGTATFEKQEGGRLFFSFVPTAAPDTLPPITLLLGFPRPIQAGRIFKDLTSLGVQRIILAGTELGEKSYIESNFFKHDEYRTALLEGAEQAANPLLPVVQKEWTLRRALELLTDASVATGPVADQRWLLHPDPAAPRFGEVCRSWLERGQFPVGVGIGSRDQKLHPDEYQAGGVGGQSPVGVGIGSRDQKLHPGGYQAGGVGGQSPDGYQAGNSRGQTPSGNQAGSDGGLPPDGNQNAGFGGLILAVGSERGWTAAELALLTEYGFATASLGRRILKSETACLAAVSLALGGLGLL